MNRARHVSQPDFLQYAVLMPGLLAHLMNAALLTYGGDAFLNDSWALDIVLDRKSGAIQARRGCCSVTA